MGFHDHARFVFRVVRIRTHDLLWVPQNIAMILSFTGRGELSNQRYRTAE